MKSPGKPSLRCDVERRFWCEIAKGLTSEDAALAVGASQAAVAPAGPPWRRRRPPGLRRGTPHGRLSHVPSLPFGLIHGRHGDLVFGVGRDRHSAHLRNRNS